MLCLVDAYLFYVNLLLLYKYWSAEIKEHIIICYSDVFPLYQMSYMWYTLLGSIVSMTVALIVSFFTNPIDPASLDPVLLSPVIRRFLPEKEVEKQDVNMALLSANKVKKDKKHTFFCQYSKIHFLQMFDLFGAYSNFEPGNGKNSSPSCTAFSFLTCHVIRVLYCNIIIHFKAAIFYWQPTQHVTE
jgi:hypothetical protein